jgi:hypothetical protein
MEPTNNLFDLQVDPQSQVYLGETAKWAKFIAIVSFVLVAIVVLGLIAAAAYTSNNPFMESSVRVYGGGVFITMAIIIALLVVIPNIFLLRFGIKMQAALRNNDQPSLVSAFANIKSSYKFVGILYIVIIALWILGIIMDVLNATAG